MRRYEPYNNHIFAQYLLAALRQNDFSFGLFDKPFLAQPLNYIVRAYLSHTKPIRNVGLLHVFGFSGKLICGKQLRQLQSGKQKLR